MSDAMGAMNSKAPKPYSTKVPKAKNPFGKMRKPGNAYFTCESGGWKWEVLKVNVGPAAVAARKPFISAFCNVHGICTEMGDTYCTDIPGFFAAYEKALAALEAAAA